MRAPFLKARVNVVLYREQWGKTKWTAVEETAVKDRCFDGGWPSLLFVMLDKNSELPKWLPKPYVRFNLEDYGIEQLVGAIKLKVQENGGKVERPKPDGFSARPSISRTASSLCATGVGSKLSCIVLLQTR
jgi:hypothetical protein